MKISKSKRIEEAVFKVLMWVAMGIVFAFVFSVIWTIFSRGVKARSNGELVEKVVRLSRELGREIASPAEARAILGLVGGPNCPIK